MTRFRLNRIIEVKEKLIEDKERELEGSIGNLNAIALEIEETEKDIVRAHEELLGPLLSGSDFSVLKDYRSYLEERRLRLSVEKSKIEETIELIRAELVELLKDLKMLETLKSKAFKAMKKSENRKEQKSLDAMALRIEERRP